MPQFPGEFNPVKYYNGYACTDVDCPWDQVSATHDDCPSCGKKFEIVELWRDDDYLELYSMMA